MKVTYNKKGNFILKKEKNEGIFSFYGLVTDGNFLVKNECVCNADDLGLIPRENADTQKLKKDMDNLTCSNFSTYEQVSAYIFCTNGKLDKKRSVVTLKSSGIEFKVSLALFELLESASLLVSATAPTQPIYIGIKSSVLAGYGVKKIVKPIGCIMPMLLS